MLPQCGQGQKEALQKEAATRSLAALLFQIIHGCDCNCGSLPQYSDLSWGR